MKNGSAFAGIGGFDLGFERAGIETVWQIEKEEFCRQVLSRHFPKSFRYADILDCYGMHHAPQGPKRKHYLNTVDVITGGVPCQDVSIAGRRTGLRGNRTVLVYEFARILKEVRPTWFVFENVPGLFSSNEGRDFAEIVRLFMVECGYGISWRVLDSHFFGVAQRRRRVFIVGCLGRPCPPEILFDSESGSWDSTARREEGTDLAVPLTSGSGKAGHQPGRRQEDDFNIVGTLQSHSKEHGHAMSTQQAAESGQIVKQAISSKWAKGSSGPSGDEYHNLVAFDTTQLTSRENRANPQPGDPCHPLSATAHAPAIAGTLGSSQGGFKTTDLDGSGAFISTSADSNRMRDFASLPQGLDSARYRALGNAVTVSVAHFIAKRLKAWTEAHSES